MKRKIPWLQQCFWLAAIAALSLTLAASWYSRTVTPQPQPESPAVLYSTETRDDLRQTYLHAIGKAERSLLLFIYSLKDRRIIQALKEKAAAGLEVTVICDAKASKGVERFLGKKVRVHAIKGAGLMHAKILVIDRSLVWIGSANMTPTSLRQHGNLVNGFSHPPLAEMIHAKARAMTQTGKVSIIGAQAFSIAGQNMEMWFFPDNTQGVARLKALMRSAEKTIKVAMFTWTREDLAEEMILAKKRGVQAEAVIDRSSGTGVSVAIVEKLWKAGIPVRLSQGDALLHHKFMLIDEQTLVNGSANWTKAAFSKNDDCMTILSPLTPAQTKHLDALWQIISADSEAVTHAP